MQRTRVALRRSPLMHRLGGFGRLLTAFSPATLSIPRSNMKRFFELLVFSLCVLATIGVFALNDPGGTRSYPANDSDGGYLSQYLFAAAVTVAAVAVLNRSRAVPLNRWRAVMLVTAIVLVGNLAVLLWFHMHVLLTQESFSDLVADVSAGAWIVLLIAWAASFRYRRSLRNVPSEQSAA